VIYSDLGINSIAELKTQSALVGFEEAEATATQTLIEIRDAKKVSVEIEVCLDRYSTFADRNSSGSLVVAQR
jgi:hypothetical protein